MKLSVRYGLMFCLLLMIVSCRDKAGKNLPDMRHTYSKRSKKPFGTFVAYNMLKEKYQNTNASFENVNKEFHKNTNTLNYKRGLYVVIAKNMLMSDEDIQYMLNYVDRGNQVFISAEYISEQLLDTLGLEAHYQNILSLFRNNGEDELRYSTETMRDTTLFGKERYGFFYYPFERSFVQTDSLLSVQKLGLNEQNLPDYISLVYGKGRFFLHLHPEAFSNYFLLTAKNKEYFERTFSYTANDRAAVYWDDYYRIGNVPDEEFSMFAVFMKYPMLKWGLLTALAVILFYVAFGSKRKQRIVPVKEKYNNDSVSFVETIGRLYLQKKDNHNIADKMITYFLEYIRTNYYLNTSQLNSEFYSSLSRKSGVNEKEVSQFFEKISVMQKSSSITDEELLELNNRIQLFLKK